MCSKVGYIILNKYSTTFQDIVHAKAKNVWSCISTPQIYHHGVVLN